jgi:hypothetical protein
MKLTLKHGFLIRDVILVALFFTGIMALFIIATGALANNYNRNDMVSDSFNNNFNKLNQLTGQVDTTRTAVNGNGTGLELKGNFDVAFSSTWTVFALAFSTLDTFAQMGSGALAEFTFIPQPVFLVLIYVLLASLLVVIIFNIISSVLRGRI